jgi:DNA-binding transcriptional LysR family regulator
MTSIVIEDRPVVTAQLGLDLDLGEVSAFVAVVRLGGFTAAARQLHLTQPGLSARVARLERHLGDRLIDRSCRRLTLTSAGRRFLPYAVTLLQTATQAQQAIRGHRSTRGARNDVSV